MSAQSFGCSCLISPDRSVFNDENPVIFLKNHRRYESQSDERESRRVKKCDRRKRVRFCVKHGETATRVFAILLPFLALSSMSQSRRARTGAAVREDGRLRVHLSSVSQSARRRALTFTPETLQI